MAKSEYNSRVGPVGFTVNTVGAELMVGENDMDGAKVTGTEERGGGRGRRESESESEIVQ